MTRSEIDDIFASKGKSKAIQQPISSSSALPGKKKQDKKRKRDSAQDTGSPLPTSDLGEEKEAKSPPKKRPAPETVIDPSTRILSAKLAKSDKSAGGRDAIKGRKTDGNSDKDNEERFKDSRGSGPRRKTEEGWAIYKEDELGIGDKGGDTSLCPFDCECCY